MESERQSGRHFDPDVVQTFLHLTRQPDCRQTSPEQHTGSSAYLTLWSLAGVELPYSIGGG